MKLKLYSFLCLLLVVCALPAANQQKIRIIHGPYLQNVGANDATIVWITDKPSVGWVEIAPDDESHFYAQERAKIFDTKIGIKRTSTIHAVKIDGLQPGVRYRYRACAQEVLEHRVNQVVYGFNRRLWQGSSQFHDPQPAEVSR